MAIQHPCGVVTDFGETAARHIGIIFAASTDQTVLHRELGTQRILTIFGLKRNSLKPRNNNFLSAVHT